MSKSFVFAPAYRHLVEDNHKPLVNYLVMEFGWEEEYAEQAVTHLWDRLVACLMKDRGFDYVLAQRIMDQTLGMTQVMDADVAHGPSPMIDYGLHVLLTYTHEIEALGMVLFGKRIQHVPNDVPGFIDETVESPCSCNTCGSGPCSHRVTLKETMAALAAFGPVDTELWQPIARMPSNTGSSWRPSFTCYGCT
jgi:hypothetical protein